jgi:mono/diheme cytochrome c family protein
MPLRTRTVALLLVPLAALAASCSDSGDASESKACEDRCGDIVASIENGDYDADGEQLYAVKCATCHGGDGQGGIGPELAGVVTDKLTPAQHVTLVLDGKGNMPAWKSQLEDDEIAAIVDYERTQLGQ